jgi:hypothetical protein
MGGTSLVAGTSITCQVARRCFKQPCACSNAISKSNRRDDSTSQMPGKRCRTMCGIHRSQRNETAQKLLPLHLAQNPIEMATYNPFFSIAHNSPSGLARKDLFLMWPLGSGSVLNKARPRFLGWGRRASHCLRLADRLAIRALLLGLLR